MLRIALITLLMVVCYRPYAQSCATNLAYGKPAYTSSEETTANLAIRAFDNNTATRWESSWADNQYLYVDLGQDYYVCTVNLNWQNPGKSFTIDVSEDGTSWTNVTTVTGNSATSNTITLNRTTRYVRMYGLTRINGYGFSLYEMQVMGTLPAQATCYSTNVALNKTGTASTTGLNTIPGAFDGSLSTRWESTAVDPSWLYVDLGGEFDLCRVDLTWESAYGANYTVDVSNDAVNWTTIKTVTGNYTLDNSWYVSGTGRYVRMYGTKRGSTYGYSLYEFAVYPVAPYVRVIKNADAAEPSTNGEFRIGLAPGLTYTQDVTVTYTVSGTATSGTDYTALSGTAVIPAGQNYVSVPVPVKDDNLAEGTETVIVTITSASSASQPGLHVNSPEKSATVNIVDDESKAISITKTADASEDGTTGSFLISLASGVVASEDITVNFTIGGTATNGTDYATLPVTAVIPAGKTSVTVQVKPYADLLTEGTETVVLTITGGTSANAVYTAGTSNTATVNIADVVAKGYIYVHVRALNEESSPDFPFTLTGGPTTVGGFSLNDQPDYISALVDIGASHGATTTGNGDGELWTVLSTGAVYHRLANNSQWALVSGVTGTAVDGAGAGQFVLVNSTGNAYFYDNGTLTTIYTASSHSNVKAVDISYGGGRIAIACNNGSILGNSTTSGSGYTDSWTTIVASGSGAARLDILPSSGKIIYYNSGNANAYTIDFAGGTATSLGAPGSTDVCFDDLGNMYSNGYTWSSGTTWVADATKGSSFKYSTGGAGGQVWSLSNSTNTAKTIYTRTTSNGVWIDDERVRTTYKDNSIIIPVVAGTYTLGITNPSSWDLAGIDLYDPTSNSTANVAGKTASINVKEGEVVHVVMHEQFLVPLSIAQNCGMSAVEDFGTGASAPSVITSYHYTSVITANDGYYTIQKATTGWYNSTLVDHTTGSGNFMIVNASYQADEFYRKRLTNLVVGQQYQMSFWVANLMPQHPIQPNITAGVASTSGVDLSTVSTGDITSTAWQQFTFTFTAQSATQDVYLRNNANGGSGNDLALDDIAINPLSGTIDDNTISGGSTTLCMGATYTLSNTTTGGKWKSTNPLVASIDSTTGVLTANTVGLDTLTYTVSNTVGCTASKQTFIQVISSPVVTATPGSAAICLGSTVALNATITSGTTPYASYAWSVAPAANAGLAGTATQNTSATPTAAGTYIYTQKVTDAKGCVGSDTALVLVNALPTATIAYGAGTYCASRFTADSAYVTRSGNNTGSYSATPSGLVFNTGTGNISLKSSAAGTYHITYTYTDNDTHCGSTATAAIVINALPTATITYSAASFCAKDSAQVTVTQSGVTSGSFSAPSGLVVNAARGTIDLAHSTAGTYRVLYTFTNSTTGCSDTTGATVVVYTMPSASIAYSAHAYYTQGSAAVTITQSGVSSGSFSAGTGLSLDVASGTINLAASTAGTYRVLYTFNNAAGCSDTTGFTVVVKDIPAVSITKGADAAEPSTNGSFVISLPALKTFDEAITVTYTVTGTATSGKDYTALSGTAVIPAGQTSVTVPVTVIDDQIIEGTETVIATLNSASSSSVSSLPLSSTANSATVNIADDESRAVTIVQKADATEGGAYGSFLVSLPTGVTTASAVTVTYTIGGTATNGTDYSTLSGTVVIPKDSTSVPIYIVALPDVLTEGTETVLLTLTGATTGSLTYTIGSSNSATVNIIDVVPKGYVYVHLRALNEESSPAVSMTLTGGPTTVAGFSVTDQPATIAAMADIGVGHGVTTDGTGDGELWASLSNGAIYKRPANSSTWALVSGQTGTSIDGAGPGQCVYVNSGGSAYFYNNGTATQIYNPTSHSSVKAVDISYGNGRIAIACSDGSILTNKTTSGTTYTDSWSTLMIAGSGITRLDILPSTGSVLYLSGTTGYTIPFDGSTAAVSVGTTGGTDVAYDDYGNMYSSGYKRTGTTTWTGDATKGTSFTKTAAGAGGQVWCISTASDTPYTLFSRTTSNGTWLDDERVRITYKDNSIMIPVAAGTYTLGLTNPASWDLGSIDIYDPTSNSSTSVATQQATINVAAGEVVHVVMHEELLVPLNISQTCSVSPVEDFGTAASAPSVVTSYHYSSVIKCNDGYYTIQKVATGWTNATLKDHSTTDGTGNFMIVNASYQADEFYRKRITNLVVGLQYQMSFWVSNLSPTNTIKPNITAGVSSTAGVVLSSVSTGTFTNTDWKQYTFTFTAQATTADVYLQNNANGGSGNDVALDDIAINPLSGTLAANTVSGGGSTTLCLGSNYTFSNVTTGGTWTVFDATKAQINASTGVLNTLATGTDTVIYTVSNAVGCVATQKTAVQIASIPAVTVTPGSAAICIGSTVALNASVTSGKTPYATYSWTAAPATNAGIVNAAIQNTTAKPTAADTYVFTSSVKDANGCIGTGNATVVVNALPVATIAYGTGRYCYSRNVNDSAKVTITGTTGGTFAASTTGLSMNVNTGSISLKNSTVGTYHITYSFTDPNTTCSNTASTDVVINSLPVAGIAYSSSSYCRKLDADSARVTQTGVTGGAYSAAAGLALNATTGAVDVKSSVAGSYRVLYTFSSATTGCSDTTGATVIIKALPVAHIAYSAAGFCRKLDADSAKITLTGTAGGSYTSTTGLTLNGVSGSVDVKSSTVGTYKVLYTFSDATSSCSDTTSAYITIKALPVAHIAFSAAYFCRKLDADSAKVTQTGTAGGVYTSAAGLTLNAVSGSVDVKSSTAGIYKVLYTFQDATTGCSDTTSAYIEIKALPVAHIAYSTASYCRKLDADSAKITQTGTTGGVYTSTAGLVLNAASGSVDVKTSVVGTYKVLYTFQDAVSGCSDTTSAYITINALPVAHIAYSAASYCRKLDADSAKIIQTGTTGGVYASTAGLTLNAASGSVDVKSSTVGIYKVLYTFQDAATGCSDTTSTNIEIKALPVAHIAYDAASFCRTPDADSAKITRTGTAGGAYTSTAGLALNAVSGSVDVKSSTAGVYKVLYTFSDAVSGCSDTTSASIEIKALPVAHIAYSAASFCRKLDADSAKITQTGTAGGTYTSTAGLALNAASGSVDVKSSTVGIYKVLYTFQDAAGGCSDTTSAYIEIKALPVAHIAYDAASYCRRLDADSAKITQTGTAGGVYTSTTGLTLNAASGSVDVKTSVAGIYKVLYTFQDATTGCSDTTSAYMEIKALPVAHIAYSAASFCRKLDADSAKVTQTGTVGGAYTSTTGLALNGVSGSVDVKSSTVGIYKVLYTFSDVVSGCSDTTSTYIEIKALPVAHIAYNAAGFCRKLDADSAKVIQTGTVGGAYTSTTGLALNGVSGSVDVKSSTVGTYKVLYTFSDVVSGCSDTTSTYIEIKALPVAHIAYDAAGFCRKSDADSATITQSGTTGGVYTSATGLALNAASGSVDVKSSTVGTYKVLYTFSDAVSGCSDTTSTYIEIKALPVAHIAYNAGGFCRKLDADSAKITQTGTTGGVYSSASGLALNVASGSVDVKSSTVGTYKVLYTFSDAVSGCSDTTSTYIEIKALPVAHISYDAASFCRALDADSAKITQTGTSGGVYTSTTGLALNAASGSVDVKSSTVGIYKVLYTFSDAVSGCSDTTGTYIEIKALPVAHIAYDAAGFCRKPDADSAKITQTGTVGGAYTSTAGLALNAVSGSVDVKSSTVGAYKVLYTFSDAVSGCSDTTSTYIEIKALPVAHIAYDAAGFCRALDADSAKITQTGTSGGVYTSTTGLALNAASGSVDVKSSTAGTYKVLYTFSDAVSGCSDTTSAYIEIKALPVAHIAYDAAGFCRTLDADSAKVTQTGTTGGAYTSTIGLTLNAASGSVDVKSSTVGIYKVLYTFSDIVSGCSDTTSTYIEIKALPIAHIAYDAAGFCRALDADSAKITQTGTSGGAYTSTAGLALNAASGSVDVKSSTVGTYKVLYTFSDAVSGCSDTTSTYIEIKALPVAHIAYDAAGFCRAPDADSARITQTGTTGGTYTSSTGLALNVASGSVDVKTSVAGIYKVLYTFQDAAGGCSDTTSTYIEIKALPVAHIAYDAAGFCRTLDADSAKITQTGTVGGTYTSTAGLALNAVSGSVDVKSSTVGIYKVLYTFSDVMSGCSDTTSTYIEIKALPVAHIAYDAAGFCRALDADSAKITQTGTVGGTYSSTVGLALNAASGSVDVKSSTVGTYKVLYTFSDAVSGCSDTTSAYIEIKALPVAHIAYNAASFCRVLDADSAKITQTGTAGGTYTSTTGLVLNAVSGSVDVKSSTVGIYKVLYTFSDAISGCSDTTSAYIEIKALPVAHIAYDAAGFCRTLDADSAKITQTGTTGGTYTSSTGLALNAASGSVDVKTSVTGIYKVLYTFQDATGGCSDTTSTYIEIKALPVAHIAYDAAGFCRALDADSAKITQTGTSGGVYTSAAGLALNAASGSVDVKSSVVGSYKVLYTFSDAVSGCSDTTSTYIEIKALPIAHIAYDAAGFCRVLNADSAKITQTGTTGGTYTSATGLALNAASGSVDVKTSVAGIYKVLYTFHDAAGGCGDTTSTYIEIKALPVAHIAYDAVSFCRTLDADSAKITQTGIVGGTYSSTVGLALNAASGSVDVKSSTAGTYKVLYTFSDVVSGCSDTTSTYIEIKALPVAYIAYDAAAFCRALDADSAKVTQTGTTGGIYTSTTGLTLNAASGSVDVKSSTVGIYKVFYTFSDAVSGCSDTTSTYIEIKALPVAHIAYDAAGFCRALDADSAKITQTGTAGGIYTSTTGLTLNAASGSVDVKSSTVGTYKVLYTFSDAVSGCSDTTSTYIEIKALPVAHIAYDAAGFCRAPDADSAKITQTGTTGGTYTSTTGLVLNAASGSVDVKTSVAGIYKVLYTFQDAAGGCSDTTSTYIEIKALPVAHIAYDAAGFCRTLDADSAKITQTGTVGGTYTSTAGLALNAVSGSVDVKSSTVGIYKVLYTFSDVMSGCSDTTSTYIEIKALPVAHIAYDAAGFCRTLDADSAKITQTGTVGGTYTSTTGLALNAASGSVDVKSSTVGTYKVLYTFRNAASGCGDTTSAYIEIKALPVAHIAYDAASFCRVLNADSAKITQTGAAGGTYTSTTGLVLNAASGSVDVKTSVAGIYKVLYTFQDAAGGCSDTTSTYIEIKALPVAHIAYNASSFCRTLDADSARITQTGTVGGVYTSASGLALNAASGSVDVKTSVAGTYKVLYTFQDAASGCSDTTSTYIEIKALPVAHIAYNAASFCRALDADSAKIIQTGTAGGVYTSTTGLTLNAASGSVDVKSSTAGIYKVLYTFSDAVSGCSDTTSTYIEIKALPVAHIAYDAASFCRMLDADSAEITQTGTTGGVYTSAAGLALNAASGSVDVKSSTVGTYKVLYTFSDAAGGCSDTTSTYIEIKALPVAHISYSATGFCRKLDADSAIITQTGTTGGVYTSTTGLALNAASGSVDVKSSTVGVYKVLYTFSDAVSGCSDTTSAYIEIKALPVAHIAYDAASFCRKLDADSARITQTGTVGGTYTSTAGLALNGTSGSVDVKTSVAGTYKVLYTFQDGVTGCSDTTSTYIEIKALPVAYIAYDAAGFCRKPDADSAKITQTGTAGGTYTSAAGLVLNAVSGSVDVKSSTVGTYKVLYTFQDAADGCSDTVSTYIEIKALPVAHIAYAAAGYCNSKYADSVRITQTGTSGGTYTAAAGLSLNAVTGAIEIKSSTPGNYKVLYTFQDAANGCSDTTSTYITIYALPVIPAISGVADICKNSTTYVTNSLPGGTWSSSNINVATVDAGGLVTGVEHGTDTIYYAVTNAAGCSDSAQFTIRIAVAPVFTLSGTSLTCNSSKDGKITVSTIETGLSYSLNSAAYQQSNVFTGLAAGTYTVTAKNAGGCTTSADVIVTQPDSVKITATHTDVICHSASTGAIDITVTGGTSPYTYNWSNGSTTEDVASLAAGNYTVIVKDANGCSSSSLTTTISEIISVFTVNTPVKQKYGLVQVSGTTIANATVKVMYPDGSVVTTTAGSNGSFTATSANDVETGQIIITVTDPVSGATCVKSVLYTKLASADVSITKELVTTGAIYTNTYATFSITVSNSGPDFATQVVTSDLLSNVIDAVDSVVASYGTTSFNSATRKLTWTIDTLRPDETMVLYFRVHIKGKGKLENTATVAAAESDPDESNNTASSAPATILTQFLIPNVLTPNGDGKNDTFFIGGIELYTGTDLMIFNRWGNEVYHSRSYDNMWSGTGLSAGVYYYILKINMPGGQQVFKGYIQLLK